jgi:sortase (surface protein transpeptidase)
MTGVRRAVCAAVLVAALAACDAGTPPAAEPSAQANPADSFESSTTYETVAAPVRLRIPALHVDSKIIDLGLQPDGAVEVPDSVSVAGWFDGGPRPGQAGPAVILGHVDSKNGPGIFLDLHRVKAGTKVEVDRADGSTATFEITKVSRVEKTRFPTDLVYAPTLDPTLRLVTCGGAFDHARGSDEDNVIAFAAAT